MASEAPLPTPAPAPSPAPAARATRTSHRLSAGPWKRPAGGAPDTAAALASAPPAGPSGAPAWPRFWEGQDVLARWTDGLLYLGTIKKVDPLRQVCLVQFEDDSQFLVLWKDINPAAVPGEERSCCVCHLEALGPENPLVRCQKCSHAYHQECHLPRVLSDGAWMCRQCVFAVATKRGGALKKGPYAKAMLSMKLVLPYQVKALEWDAEHLTNRQQCYCYCGGPGEWNLKMLQCRRCAQWFHEACTQCLSKPLLYGDRFYVFECSVCRGGPETVHRLPLRWVDVAHLILYHLSICCKKKYFDFEREILPFASENWDSLLLGELSDTPKVERYSQLLNALTTHKDRFISGKEIKKRKGLFGLHLRVPPPAPYSPGRHGDSSSPLISDSSFLSGQGGRRGKGLERRKARPRRCRVGEPPLSVALRSTKERERLERALTQDVVQNPASANQSYSGFSGTSGTYNFRRTDARCQDSASIRMFASFHPSANTAGTLSTSSRPSLDPCDPAAATDHESPEHSASFLPLSAPASKPLAQPPASASSTLCAPTSTPSTSSYFGAMGRLARGEAVRILARRITTDGTIQYLVEWDGGGMF